MKTLLGLLLVVLLSACARADWFYVYGVADTGNKTVPEGIEWSQLYFTALVWESGDFNNDSWDDNEGYLGRFPYTVYTSHFLSSNPSGYWSAYVFSGNQRVRDFYTHQYYRVSWPASWSYNMPAIAPDSWPWVIPNVVTLPITFTIVSEP